MIRKGGGLIGKREIRRECGRSKRKDQIGERGVEI